MATFNSLSYKRDLKNAQHFAFIQAFITALQQSGMTAQKIQALLTQLTQAFAVEDRYYMQVRASEIVAQREAADQLRDRFYTRLHRLIQAWAGSGMEALDAAATALEKVFNLYRVKINAQMDEETGQLENLIADLSTQQMQAHLTTINGQYLFQMMKQGHDDVKSLRLEQGVETSQKELGALAAARRQCDTLYDQTTQLIESFALVADDPTPYETFIRQWNGTVKLYQDMLDRKTGTTGTSSSSGSDSTGSSSGTDTGSTDTGDSGTGTDTGTGGTGTGGTGTGGTGTDTGGSSSDTGGSSDSGSGSCSGGTTDPDPYHDEYGGSNSDE
jgi:hypothetical protein